MSRQLLKGNEAIAEAAVRAGLQAYFGYPITPQTELLEYLSLRMPELGRGFVQAESELAAINMVYGAACTGARVMTSSSSPGISLMMEGLSYIAGTELPVVMVDVMRGGPGLGNLGPSQGDYNQIVHGGGHGDYHCLALAPSNVQEAIDMTAEAFDLAEQYRMITWIVIDGLIGQIMEPAELPPMQPLKTSYPDWATRGAEGGRKARLLKSFYVDTLEEEAVNIRMLKRWQEAREHLVRYRAYYMEDAQFAVIGFGSAGRIALSAVRAARAEGIKVGLLRPLVISPFPEAVVREVADRLEGILVVEMNAGMMLDDVLLATEKKTPVEFYGRVGGNAPLPDEILEEIHRLAKGPLTTSGHPRDRWFNRISKNN
ncbi:MAG: 3-methyl-2-oxobutanoate dehydrogenase subunit VorB [Anaerolineae bacterium]|nr:3-methyl-2-oxobutanoate dehydrogenase subunit VorB [Anaerolineae bacterium]